MTKLDGALIQVPELVGFVFMVAGVWQNADDMVLLGAIMFTYGIVNKTYIMVRQLYRFMLFAMEAVDKVMEQVAKGDARITIRNEPDGKPVPENE